MNVDFNGYTVVVVGILYDHASASSGAASSATRKRRSGRHSHPEKYRKQWNQQNSQPADRNGTDGKSATAQLTGALIDTPERCDAEHNGQNRRSYQGNNSQN